MELAQRGRDLALRAGDTGRAAEGLFNVINAARREGVAVAERRHLARQLVIEAEKLPAGPHEDDLRVASLIQLGSVELDALHLPEARQLAKEAMTIAEAKGLTAGLQDARTDMARIDIVFGNVADGLAENRSIGDESRATAAEVAAVTCYRDGALYAIRSLEYGQAKRRLADGMRYSEAIEQSYCGHLMASAIAVIAWGEGRWGEAVDLGSHALSDTGSARSKAIARWALGFTALGRGDRASADEHLGAAVDFGRTADWVEMILQPQWGLAEAALVAGDPAAAIVQCEGALALARERGEWALLAPFAVTGVRAYQTANKPEAAARFLDQVIRALGPAREIAAPAVHHATGLVKLAEGSVSAARDALQAAVAGWDDRGRRWEALWARLDLAAADLRANRYGEAMALVREVRVAAESMGSQPLLDRAEQLTRLAKGRGAELEPWHPLTTREFEVAKKIADGLTNVQIGEELYVSPKTVNAHVEHILAKLGVARRTEIAAWAAGIKAPETAPGSVAEVRVAASN
jgi:DNA-binding CsgD family transcriptional regulator